MYKIVDGERIALTQEEIDEVNAPRPITSADVEARAEQCFAEGFPPSHTAFEGQRLQVRNVEDRTNWLTSKDAYDDARAAGMGAVMGANFRTLENNTVTISFDDGLAVLQEMSAWAKAVMQNSWDLKDRLASGEALTSEDLETGWPSR